MSVRVRLSVCVRVRGRVRVGECSMGSIFGGLGARARVILVLRECLWNAPTVSLVFPAFEDTGSLGSPPRRVVYPPGSTLGD